VLTPRMMCWAGPHVFVMFIALAIHPTRTPKLATRNQRTDVKHAYWVPSCPRARDPALGWYSNYGKGLALIAVGDFRQALGPLQQTNFGDQPCCWQLPTSISVNWMMPEHKWQKC
jgi:hypothetical protein